MARAVQWIEASALLSNRRAERGLGIRSSGAASPMRSPDAGLPLQLAEQDGVCSNIHFAPLACFHAGFLDGDLFRRIPLCGFPSALLCVLFSAPATNPVPTARA